MMPSSNFKARQLSSAPKIHRANVLSAISQKTHDTTAQVVHLKVKGKQMQDSLQDIPDDVQSRLAWLNNQLSNF